MQFGKVDANKFSELATEYNIAISTTSWQLPTLILFQDGEEVVRLPQFKADGTVVKTILDKVSAFLQHSAFYRLSCHADFREFTMVCCGACCSLA